MYGIRYSGIGYAYCYGGSDVSSLVPVSGDGRVFDGNPFELVGGQTYHLALLREYASQEGEFTVAGPFLPELVPATAIVDLGTGDSIHERRVMPGDFTGAAERYTWTPASSGVATVTVDSVFMWPSATIYRSAEETLENLVASFPREASSVKFEVEAGQLYSIATALRPEEDFLTSRFMDLSITVVPDGGLGHVAPDDVQISRVGNVTTLTWTPAVGTQYQLQSSIALAAGWEPVGEATTGGTVSADTGGAPRMFFRLVASAAE